MRRQIHLTGQASLDKGGQKMDGVFISAADLAPDIPYALSGRVNTQRSGGQPFVGSSINISSKINSLNV